MKVFVGFGYNKNDEWIKDTVVPFITALGCEVFTGEEMHGENLAEGVIDRIKESDVCIGFLTKRNKKPDAEGNFNTHQWVYDELSTARNNNKPFFAIREKGVDPQKGIIGDRQRFDFDERLMVFKEITKFIVKEKRKLNAKIFMLLPQEILTDIRPHLASGDIKCSYRFMHKAKRSELEHTTVEKFLGGLGIIVNNIPDDDASIEIVIKGPQYLSWSSGFVSVGSINVQLNKDR